MYINGKFRFWQIFFIFNFFQVWQLGAHPPPTTTPTAEANKAKARTIFFLKYLLIIKIPLVPTRPIPIPKTRPYPTAREGVLVENAQMSKPMMVKLVPQNPTNLSLRSCTRSPTNMVVVFLWESFQIRQILTRKATRT